MPAAHFSPISRAFEETAVEYPFNTRPEFSSYKEDQSCSQIVPPFEGFGELHNQFRNTVTENSTGSSSLTSNENISDSLESEVNSQSEPDSRVNEELSLTNLQLFIFDRPGDLEEINIDQPRRFQTTITSTRR